MLIINRNRMLIKIYKQIISDLRQQGNPIALKEEILLTTKFKKRTNKLFKIQFRNLKTHIEQEDR